MRRYYIVSETEHGEDSSMIVDAESVDQAISLYKEKGEQPDWELGEIKHIWLLPELSSTPKALEWNKDMENVY